MELGRIGFEDTSTRHDGVMRRAFDGIKTAALDEVDLKVTVGPCEFEIPLLVVNKTVVFNLLLG